MIKRKKNYKKSIIPLMCWDIKAYGKEIDLGQL